MWGVGGGSVIQDKRAAHPCDLTQNTVRRTVEEPLPKLYPATIDRNTVLYIRNTY